MPASKLRIKHVIKKDNQSELAQRKCGFNKGQESVELLVLEQSCAAERSRAGGVANVEFISSELEKYRMPALN